jgi:hypothetical protein
MIEDELKAQVCFYSIISLKNFLCFFKNLVLTKKVDDLRSKLTEESQKNDVYKNDVSSLFSF